MSAFEKIIGYDREKKELMQIGDILKNAEVYEKLGVTAPAGLLLYGKPGVGKTSMAQALIEDSGRQVFLCRKDKGKYEFINSIKEVFTAAAANAPSIVFLDDMDKYADTDDSHKNAEEYVTIQSCIDEIKNKGVFVLATVNEIDILPDSLLRAGRFDQIMEIEVPRGAEAVEIIKHYLKDKDFELDEKSIKTVARIMDGCSCAKLETAINTAGQYAGYERAAKIMPEHLIRACIKMAYEIKLDSEEYIANWSEYAKNGDNVIAQIIYHEAGHAVVSEVLCPGSVTFILAQKDARYLGGLTSCYNDASYPSLKWRQSRIIGALGGKAAVDLKYGMTDMGASRDLEAAFAEIKDLLNNGAYGLQIYSPERGRSFLFPTDDHKQKQEQVICAEMERNYRKAKEILMQNIEFLEKLAVALAQKGFLLLEDIQKIKAECQIAAAMI